MENLAWRAIYGPRIMAAHRHEVGDLYSALALVWRDFLFLFEGDLGGLASAGIDPDFYI